MYKNVNTSFNMIDEEQKELYDFVTSRKNASGFIKELLKVQLEKEKKKATHKRSSLPK